MKGKVKGTETPEELLLELADLQTRLEEAEETLRAIREGEVDALVVESPLGQQVYSLKGAEQPYRVLVETMNEAALTVTRDGTVLYCNSRLSDLLGLPINQIIGASLHDFVAQPDGRQSVETMLAGCGPEGCRGEFVLKGLAGQEVPVSLSGRPLILDDVDAFCVVAADLTDQKRTQLALREAYETLRAETEQRTRLEEQLLQSQKMEALGTLAGGVAHDFNNILAAIIGFSEMAAEDLPAASVTRRYLERVLSAGLRGRELTKRILTFSRQVDQEKKPLRMSNVVEETVKLLRASLPSTINIRFRATAASDLVLADPAQIQQVVLNLITNAAHAVGQTGGMIALDITDFSFSSVAEAPAPYLSPGSYVRLSVTDTGHGMPPEIMERIFDPFFTTKGRGEGTGLGLSVVHGIVESHRGAITVRSKPGEGATFAAYFPCLAGVLGEEREEGTVLTGGQERVLFVDDEEALALMAKEVLERLGYEVTAKTDAREALALFRLNPDRFDLIVTDQTMPDLTGVELAKEALDVRKDIPVILCTGFSHTVDAETAKAAGVRAFLMKPLTRSEISQAVRQVLDEPARA